MTKTVVLAVDSSSGSEKAVQWTLDNLLSQNDKAVIVHVEPGVESEPGLFLYPEASVPPGVMAAVKRKRRDASESLTNRLLNLCRGKQVVAEAEILEGDPRTTLVNSVSRHKADLMVVGSRNLGTMERIFLGSVSKYCVQNSPCPVLVFREGM